MKRIIVARVAGMLMAMGILMAGGGKVMAADPCPAQYSTPPQNIIMSLTDLNAATVASMPVGSVLYKSQVDPYLAMRGEFDCIGILTWQVFYEYDSVGYGLWSGDIGIESGKIYQTGVDGIGFVIKLINHWGTSSTAPTESSFYTESTPVGFALYHHYNAASIQFIKTGPISPGTITGSMLPVMSVYLRGGMFGVVDGVDYGGGSFEYKMLTVSIVGTMSFTAPTCLAEDKEVQMGSYSASAFTGVGSATDWKDGSVTLICDRGFDGAGNTHTTYYDKNLPLTVTGETVSSRNPSSWQVTFSASTVAIDPALGIISLDTSTGSSATGIGIQLSKTNSEAGIYNLNVGGSDVIEYGSSSFTIPVWARYIQTDATVTEGTANSSVVYTVTYQ